MQNNINIISNNGTFENKRSSLLYGRKRTFRNHHLSSLSDFNSWNSSDDADYSEEEDIEQNFKTVRFLILILIIVSIRLETI